MPDRSAIRTGQRLKEKVASLIARTTNPGSRTGAPLIIGTPASEIVSFKPTRQPASGPLSAPLTSVLQYKAFERVLFRRGAVANGARVLHWRTELGEFVHLAAGPNRALHGCVVHRGLRRRTARCRTQRPVAGSASRLVRRGLLASIAPESSTSPVQHGRGHTPQHCDPVGDFRRRACRHFIDPLPSRAMAADRCLRAG